MRAHKIFILLILLSALIIAACEHTLNDYFVDPKAGFTLSADEVFVYQTVDIINQSEGQQFILFSGQEGSEYDSLYTAGAVGIAPNNGENFSISYVKPGTYNITLVASGYRANEKETVTDIMQQSITVKDSSKSIVGVTFLNMFSITRINRDGEPAFTNFTVEGVLMGDHIQVEMYSPWNPLVWDNNRNPILNPANGRFSPTFELNTNYYSISVEGSDEFENGKTVLDFSDGVDRFVPKTVSIQSDAGSTKEYELCILQIPQFSTFTLGGISGQVRYDFIDLKQFYVDLEVPAETDVTALVADFSSFQPGTSVSVNGVPQESGITANDYTEPVTFDLRFEQPGYEQVFYIDSKVQVTVVKQ